LATVLSRASSLSRADITITTGRFGFFSNLARHYAARRRDVTPAKLLWRVKSTCSQSRRKSSCGPKWLQPLTRDVMSLQANILEDMVGLT
jgi:hypothetical protein